jgi:hypothetical protein
MIRNLALVALAAGTLVTGMMITADDASAKHRRYGGITIHLGGYGGYHGYRHRHCKVVRVRQHGYWQRVKRCWSHRHY